MAYVVSFDLQSPYIPRGLKVLDDATELMKSRFIGGKWIDDIIKSGLPFEEDLVPRRFSVDVPAERLPGLFSLRYGHGVKDKFRSKVEELEPGIHQFFPIDLTTKGGTKPSEQIWLFHVCNRLDALNLEAMGFPNHNDKPESVGVNFDSLEKIKLIARKEIVAGKSVWYEQRFRPGAFFSDELFGFVKENKITKLESWYVQEL